MAGEAVSRGDERPLASVCSGALLLGRARVKIAAQMEYRGYSPA